LAHCNNLLKMRNFFSLKFLLYIGRKVLKGKDVIMASIAALMMARAMGSQYYGGNMFAAMDGKMALNRVNFGGNLDNQALQGIANKDKQYDLQIAQERLNYQVADKMQEQEKALQKRWADSFKVFDTYA